MSAYPRADIVSALVSRVCDTAALRSSLPLGIDLADPAAVTEIVEQTVRDLVGALAASDAESVAARGDLVARRLSGRFSAATRPEPVAPLATVDAISAIDG